MTYLVRLLMTFYTTSYINTCACITYNVITIIKIIKFVLFLLKGIITKKHNIILISV